MAVIACFQSFPNSGAGEQFELAGESERWAHPAAGVGTMDGLAQKSGKVIASMLQSYFRSSQPSLAVGQ